MTDPAERPGCSAAQPTAEFPFPGDVFPADLGAVVQRTVAAGERPALAVVHDHDGYWLVQDGVSDPAAPGASIIHHMAHLVERDRSVGETASLPIGHVAWRFDPSDPWTVEVWPHGDDD